MEVLVQGLVVQLVQVVVELAYRLVQVHVLVPVQDVRDVLQHVKVVVVEHVLVVQEVVIQHVEQLALQIVLVNVLRYVILLVRQVVEVVVVLHVAMHVLHIVKLIVV